MTRHLDLDALRAAAEAARQDANGWDEQAYPGPWQTMRDLADTVDALIDRLRKAEAKIEAMCEELVSIECIHKERGDTHLFDAIDNDGVLYQSHYLADLLAATPASTPTDSADSEGAKG